MYKNIKKSIKDILLYILNYNEFFFVLGQKFIALAGHLTWPNEVYGQRAEDYFIYKLLAGNESLVYLDIGSYHPIRYSNTYKLYKNGASGFNVDMSHATLKIFNNFRKRDTNICAAINYEDNIQGVGYYLEGNGLSPLNTLDLKTAKEHSIKYSKTIKKEYVDILSLKTLFEKYNIEPSTINFLNIDIEGLDHVVLEQWPFNISKPKVICVELHMLNIKDILESKVHSVLDANGYTMAYWLSPSIIYVYTEIK